MSERLRINIGTILEHKITKSLWRVMAYGAGRVSMLKIVKDGMGKWQIYWQKNWNINRESTEYIPYKSIIRRIFWIWLFYRERKDIKFPMWMKS